MGSRKVPGYSVRKVLIAFALGVSLPLVLLLAVLLLRSTAAERAELERRLLQVANNLAELIDRDIDRGFALLQTLATSPAISSEDWPSFYDQAKAALAGKQDVPAEMGPRLKAEDTPDTVAMNAVDPEAGTELALWNETPLRGTRSLSLDLPKKIRVVGAVYLPEE